MNQSKCKYIYIFYYINNIFWSQISFSFKEVLKFIYTKELTIYFNMFLREKVYIYSFISFLIIIYIFCLFNSLEGTFAIGQFNLSVLDNCLTILTHFWIHTYLPAPAKGVAFRNFVEYFCRHNWKLSFKIKLEFRVLHYFITLII